MKLIIYSRGLANLNRTSRDCEMYQRSVRSIIYFSIGFKLFKHIRIFKSAPQLILT